MSPHNRPDKLDKAQLIDNRQQLVDFLLRGGRPRDEWGVGIETEKLVVDRDTGEAASYERIRELLERLDGIGGWDGILSRVNSSVCRVIAHR